MKNIRLLLTLVIVASVAIAGCDSGGDNKPAEKTEIHGCMDKAANNYNSNATIGNGSCEYDIPGCIDENAENYNSNATLDDGSCEYPVSGCTDALAENYDSTATVDDGSCEYSIPGCMDETAKNYDYTATADDGSCEYDILGCMDETAENYNSNATLDDGSCEYPVPGCMDEAALNYDSTATTDNGTCEYEEKKDIKTFSGADIPWYNYGWDVGRNPWGGTHGGLSSKTQLLDDDFSFLYEHGVRLVRVFIFCDLRSGLIFDELGNPVSFDEYVMDDFTALVSAAKESDIKLIPVLFDYMLADGISNQEGTLVGEHPDLITDPIKRKALMDLLEEFISYFSSEQIYAWETMNEPLLATAVSREELKIFFGEIIDLIHTSNQKATLGCINRGELVNWTDIGLDIYQFHYYDVMESEFPLDYQVDNLGLDKPVLIGEIEPTNVSSKLDLVSENGYEGVLFWSLNANYDFRSKADEYKEWTEVH